MSKTKVGKPGPKAPASNADAGAANQDEPLRKVGPGFPPIEHRWPKGFCPNPRGRPIRKITEMKIPTGFTPIQRQVLEHAREIVSEANGKPVTNFDTVLRAIKAHIATKPELAKVLFEMYREADIADHEFKMLVLELALEDKEVWGPKFAEARKRGHPPPPHYPDPDDIVIQADGTVKFLGPITADEARRRDEILKARDQAFAAITLIMADTGELHSAEWTLGQWRSLRRKYYRYLSPLIYKKDRISFPRFEVGGGEAS